MFEIKKGGFSSALSEVERRFFGFDYVYEPNSDDNHGYVLNAATENDAGKILEIENEHRLAIMVSGHVAL